MDETGVMLCNLGSAKVLVGKDDPRDYRGAGVKRTMVTAIECISGNGRSLLPMVIWPATTHRSNWTTFPTPGWHYACSESGYTDFRISFECLTRVFDPQTKGQADQKPRVLICDGFGTHETLEILEFCFENNITLCRLPSHTSHKLQPCDVGVFAPLKAAYREHESSVFFTRFPPNQSDISSLLPFPSSGQSVSSTGQTIASSKISANIDSAAVQMTTLICRLQILSDDLQKALQSGGAVQTSQRSPCAYLENVGPKSIPIAFHFPAPVIKMKSKTRIARKSLYIEVDAPLADATIWKSFPAHLYPVCLAPRTLLIWNLSRLNLKCLPIIDISKKAEIQWLNAHTGRMFNIRERQLKTQPTSTSAEIDVRFALRDSLFSLFIHFTGLQGQRSHFATLNNPAGGGVHVIILISSLKLDLSNRTVVLDCAVLPLTDRLMPQLGPFLSAFSSQNIYHIKVNADQLQLWKQNLPAMVERCRSWPHLARCEYRTHSCIPLSTENGQQVICSCGNGKMPANFITGVPHWESVSRYFVRAAISLCFSTAFSEELFNVRIIKDKIQSRPT